MPTYKDIEAALAAWREAERQFAAARPGSPDEDRLAVEVLALREEYQRLQEQARAELESGEPLLAD